MPFDPITGRTTGAPAAPQPAGTPTAGQSLAAQPDVQLVRLAARILRAPELKKRKVRQVQKLLQGFYAPDLESVAKQARLDSSDVERVASLGKEKPGTYDIEKVAMTPLNILNTPSQVVQGALAEGPSGAFKGLYGKEQFTPIQSVLRATGRSKNEAAKIERGLPGIARFSGNLAGSIILDPLTYVSFGTTGVSKGAVRSVAPELAALRNTGAGDIAQLLLKRGLKEITPAERDVLRQAGKLTPRLERELRGAPGGIKVLGKSVAFKGREGPGILAKTLEASRAVRGAEELTRTQPLLRQAEHAGQLAPGTTADVQQLFRRYVSKASGVSGRDLEVGYQASRGLDEAARARIGVALETGPDAVARLAPKEREAAGVLATMRATGTEEQIGRGILHEAGSGAQPRLPGLVNEITDENYFPRFSAETRSPGGAPAAPLSASLAPNLRTRTLRDMTTVEADAALKAKGRPGFELDPFVAFTRRKILANRDVAKVDLVNGLRGIRTTAGDAFVQTADEMSPELRRVFDATGSGERVAGTQFVKKELPVTTTDEVTGALRVGKQPVLVHQALASDPAFERVIKIMSDESAQRAIGKAYGKALTLWKGYATVLGPFAGGFALRNLMGNVINGFYLTGMLGQAPYLHGLAFNVRHQLEKAVGEGADNIFKYVRPRDQKLLQDALDTGVIGEGFFRLELGGMDDWAKAIKEGIPKGARVNPLSTRFAPLAMGRKLNNAIEETSRLAAFMGFRRRGFSPDEASSLVQKYLFDYGDLSTADRAIKQVVPFWTWTRKNVPLQLETLAKQPGKLSHQAAVIQAAQQQHAPYDPLALQQWMKENDAIVAPFKVGGNPVAVMPDIPATSVYQSLDPLMTAAQNPKGFLDDQDFYRKLMLAIGPGGPAGGGITALLQAALGRELFSQREFKPGEKRLGLPARLEFLLENTLPQGPGVTKVRGLVDPASRTRRLLSLLAQSAPLTDQTKRNELFRRLALLEQVSQGSQLPPGKYAPTTTKKFNPLTGKTGG